jgi:hypothetical protein
MIQEIEALLRACDAQEHDSMCTIIVRGPGAGCDCGISLIDALAAAVRAELAREPDQSFAAVLHDIEERLAIGTLYTTERELLERAQNAIKTLSGYVAACDAREPVELTDAELVRIYSDAFPFGATAVLGHPAGLRAVARAARGEK